MKEGAREGGRESVLYEWNAIGERRCTLDILTPANNLLRERYRSDKMSSFFSLVHRKSDHCARRTARFLTQRASISIRKMSLKQY